MAENVSILFRVIDQTAQAFSRFRQNLVETQSQIKKLSDGANKLRSALENAFVGGAIAIVLRDIIARTIESERALNQFQATLKATGGSVGLASFQISQLVDELAKTTAFDGTDIQRAANALLRFRDIQGDTFREALKLVPDLATAMGTDLVAAADHLGHALEDGVSGFGRLSRVAGDLNEAEKQQINNFQRVGNAAGAADVILRKLTGSIGGQAAGDNVGLYGATRSIDKAWDDLAKTVGKSQLFSGATVAGIDAFTTFLQGLETTFNGVGEAAKRNIPLIAAVIEERRKAALIKPEAQREVVQPTTPEERAEALRNRQAAAVQKAKTEAEARRLILIQQNKDAASLAKANADIQLAATKQSNAQQQSLLDDQFAKGLISAKEYYDSLTLLAQKNAKADVAALQQSIDAEQKLLIEAQKNKPEDVQALKNQILTAKAEQDRRLNESAGIGIKNARAQADAEQELADAIGEVNAKLEENRGNLAQAEAIRFAQSNRVLRQQIISKFGADSGEAKKLQTLRDQTVVSKQLAEVQERASITQQQLGVEEERIQNSLRVGAIGQFDALRLTEEARKKALATLQKQLEEEEKIAAITQDPKNLQAIAEFKSRIEQLAASTSLIADQFRTTFKDALTSPLADFINGTKSAGQAFNEFVRNIGAALSRMAAENIAQSIFGKGSAGGGVGDIFAGIFGGASGGVTDFLKGLFKSGGGGAASSIPIGLAAGGVMDSYGHMTKLPRFAYGGTSRRPAIFGERGAEAAVPLPDGRRIPVDLRGGGKQPMQVSIVQNFNGPADQEMVRRSSQQLIRQMGKDIQRQMARA